MEQDERSQKLLAGKEKLAAFQRKRSKRKKKKDTDDGASEYTWSETSSLADLSDVASTGDFSDTGSVVDEENEWGRPVSRPQVSQSVALVRAQNDVRKMSSRITELEETLQGKQDAMSRLMEENKQLQASQAQPTQSMADLPGSAPGSLDDQGGSTDDRETDDQNADESYQHKLDEFEEALKKRDEVIAQLTENLRATTVSRDNLQQEYTVQAGELARQVQTLQLQLKQAGELLKNHMGEHGISAHALLEAKNELLALQQVNSHQEQDLTAARAAISERDQALHKLIEQYKTAAEQANLIHHEYGRVQQQNVQSAQLIEQLTRAREEAQSEKLATLQQCQELQNKAADTDLHSQQLSQQLEANQLRIQTLETSLQEASLDISRMKEVVEQKDESLKQMVHSLTSISNDQDAGKILRDTVEQQQNEISSLQDAVHHKDQKLHQLNEKFVETSEQLKNLYTEVAALKEKEKEVIVLRQTIHEREEAVTALQNNIQAKEQKLLALQQSFTEQQNGNNDGFEEENNEKTVTNLKDELNKKEKLLQEVSERFTALAEKSGKLEDDSANVLLMKLQQLSQDNATLLEENKQLKEAENEINEIAEKIPQLSHEIQRLGEENRELKQKENQMYQLIEDMKKREEIVNALNNEKQQLNAAEEALQKENQDLQQKLISLQDVRGSLEEIQSKYSELQQRINTLESERNLLLESEDLLKKETLLLKERNESLNRDAADMEPIKLEHSELLQSTKAADTERETTAVKLAALQEAYDKIILESKKNDDEKKFLASQVAELEQQLRTTTRDVEEHQRSAAADSTESEVAKHQVESLGEVVKEKEASLSHLSETVTKLTAEVTTLTEENQRLVEQSSHFERLQTELESSNGELSNLRASLQQKEAMLEDTRNSVNNLEMQVSVLHDENKALKEKQNELRHLKDLVAAREKEVVDLGKSILEKDKVIEEMSVSMNDLKEISASLNSTIAEKEKTMEELQGALTESKSNISDMSCKINEAEGKINQLQLENKGLQEQGIDNENVQVAAVSEKDCIITGLQESLGVKQVEFESLQNKLRQSEEDKAELESASSKLTKQLIDLTRQIDELNHDNQDLLSQLSSKEDLNEKLEETIKEKQASLTELEEKVGLLTEELNRTHTECEKLQNEADEKENQMTVLKKELSDYEIKVEKYDNENALLQTEVQSLKQDTEELREKEDVWVRTEEEVNILKETLKERDERLVELTDNMTKLTDEVGQMAGMNQVLQAREEQLIGAQQNVKQHIDVVNERIETLKAENETLAAKEHELLESDSMLVEANANLLVLQQDYDTMKATQSELLNTEQEYVAMKEEFDKMALRMSQLDEENNKLRSQIETHELQDQLAPEAEHLIATVKSQNVTAAQQTDPDQTEVFPNVDLSTHKEDSQKQLEKRYAENRLAVNKQVMASDMPDVVWEDETVVVAQAAPVEEAPSSEQSDEMKLLLVALGQKDEEVAVLQSSIHTQHAAMTQMHQQLTEVTKYVTYLNDENQALKAKLLHSPTTNTQEEPSPTTQEAPSPNTNTESDAQEELEIPKVDSAQGGELSEGSIEKPTVEVLQLQLDQQQEAIEDMSERYSKLVEENHAMKLEINRNSDKVEPSTLKAENETLAAKEHELLESDSMLVEANAKLLVLQQDYDTMKATQSELLNREQEYMAMKEEIDKLTLRMSQLDEENNKLRSQIETHELQDQLAPEPEHLIAAVKSQNVTAAQQTDPDQTEVFPNVDLSTHKEDSQKQLEKRYAENRLAVNEKVMASDMPDVVWVDETVVVAQAAPVEEALSSEQSDEMKLLLVALGQKDEEVAVLQSSIHTQHAAMTQMHQQLTEVTKYVTYLNDENQALKTKLSHSPTTNTQEEPSPNTQETSCPNTNTESDPQEELEVPKLDSAQGEEPSEGSIEKPTVEVLQSQIDQQQEALEDMSERYSKLVEENHAMKLQINRNSEKVEPSTNSMNMEKPQTKDEEPENTDIVALHAYIQQQNAHMEQMSQRMNEMAQYITQVQEQNKLLQEKDEINSKALLTQTQASDEAEKQRKQLEEQLQKENQLQDSLESNSESLTKLDQENKILKQKEKESTEVVQQLMKDIENIRRSRSQSPSHSDVVTLEGSVSAAEHERALAALRAELEEQHGEQIVEMKQQYREQIMSNMNEQLKQMTDQRDDALERLSAKETTASQEYSPEEVESLNLVIQQCQLKLSNMEDERAEYLLKLQEQQDRFSEELAVIGRERDTTRAEIAELELRNEKAVKEFEQLKEDQSKEVELLNQRLAEVISDRDQAVSHIEKLKIEETGVGSDGEESRKEPSAREQHVEEMAKQLQDLARERDEALARIQAQEQSLNQPLQHQQPNVQSQVVDALKSEIDALNSQLNDVTSAKEEALTHVEKLQKAINSQAEEPSESHQQGGHHEMKTQTTPQRRKVSPQQKPLSPMQQQLLQLQQQLLQESPPTPEAVQQETEVVEAPPPASVTAEQVNTEQGADKADLQLKQMQEIYDQHCQLQAHQIEQLTAELARLGREREELTSQLEQYQKHYDSHVHSLVEQGKKEAADKVKAIHEELNEARKERDIVTEKFESLQLHTKNQIRELTEQVAGWKSKYHEMGQSFNGDSAVVLARVQAETASLQSQIDDLQAKLEASEKEKEDAKAQAKELKIAYYDLEGKNPNVAGYRQKLEDIEATLKVTWIENEELKVEVASLKSRLQKEDGSTPAAEADNIEDVESVRARLVAVEAELDRLQPLIGVEVIVLMRQMEDLRSTFSHQLRVRAQELTAVKCELARYQSLDSDSSESPVHHSLTQSSPDKKYLDKPDSVDGTNIELGRAQAEHQLEVDSLKKSKGEFALELHAEKERHRDAMARIEQLLKEMVNMQQKHRDDMEAVRKNHEETVHQMSVHIEEMKLQQLVNPANGSDNVSEMKVHFDTIINEKQRLLTEREQLLQEKGDWDAERDRLKGRIAQVVGEKDLIAKERDVIRESIQKLEQGQTELMTQQRLIDAEKQQLMFERDFLKEQANQDTPQSDNDHIKSLQAALNKYKDQVSLLQQERGLLVDDHTLETRSLTAENGELKLRLIQAESEKQQELEELRERLGFDINELQIKLETMEQEELSNLRAENEQLVKEYTNRAVTQMAEWKLQREDMEKEFEVKLESLTKEVEERLSLEIGDLKMSLRDALQEAEQVKKERDTLTAEHTDMLEAVRAQETEVVKLQTACSHLKEERDVLQSEYSGMLTSLQQEAADTRVPHLTAQVQHLTTQRQAMQEEHTQAVSGLQEEHHTDRARLQHLLDEANTKHTQDLHECTARYEAEVEVYKQKHAEVLEEVHTLRRENYEMRTVVSDPRTQQNMAEVACTTQTLTQSAPDSSSPDTTTASDEERDFHKIEDEYRNKLKALEDEHEKDLQEKEASLQERYELSQRQLQVEYQCDLQDQAKKIKEDAARETHRQLKVARIENERRFVTELQTARHEMSSRYESQLETLRLQYEQQDLHQTTGLTTHQLQDIVTRLQVENKDLAETRDALLQQIDKAHGHQEELQEEVTAVSTQKDALSTENLQLQHRLSQLQHTALTTHTEHNWHPLPDSTVHFTRPSQDNAADSIDHQQLLEKYSMVLGENQKLQQRLAEQGPVRVKSPSIPDSLEGSLEPPDLMMRLQDQIRGLQKENDDLRSHLDDQNMVAHEELGELQVKYIQLVAENESLRANLEKYQPDDLLDDIDIRGADRRETVRLQSCYATLAEENEVLRAKLGSYGLPTESAAEEENLDLASRYELIRKENEGLRAKLQAYTHQGALERDGCWKKKYDGILRDYAILRGQLEELGLPINDSIQKGLEELQVKFDQVVKEKETLQVKLTTVRDNAEHDFRELQARHAELQTNHTAMSKEHADFKALLEKDKDKSKREYIKTKSKLSNTSKELESLRSKFEKATKETDALKLRLEQAEARLKQEASSGAPGAAGKGKKRKQERGNHSKGRKQRRESEALDDSVEMADQTIQEELDSLTTQYTSVVRENDALKSEVGGLKCELGSLKSRLMDSLRHRLRDPPVAHSTPLDSDFTHSQGNQDGLASTPTGRPKAGGGQQADGGSSNPSCSMSDLDLSSPEDVEALRLQHEAALQELGQLRNELDRMNSKALDELMGLQSEADALEEENASMKQALRTDGAENTDPSSQGNMKDVAHHTQTVDQLQQQLITVREQLNEVQCENEELRQIIGKAAGTSEQGNVRKDNSLSKKRGNASNLTHRNVHSESDIHPVRENTEMAAASEQLSQKQNSKRTVSLDSVGVEVPVTDFGVEVKQPPLHQEGHSMNTVIPSSGLEGGQLEAEWKRIVRMRNRAESAGDAVAEEGFHPEVDRHALSGNQTGAFIPDSPNMETQLVWPSPRADSADLPLMSIEDEFKLQLESMVANFGEQNVREQLGRDYIEIHQKCEAVREENDKLRAEACKNREEVIALGQHIGELDKQSENGNEVFLSGEPGDGVGEVRELQQELVQLRDENQLLVQEVTTLESQCESRNAKSAWQKTVMKGDLESELDHLRSDRAKLEDEMGKIKGLYSTVKEHSDKLSVENEELSGDKVRLERELQVLRSVLEALRQEQVKVEDEIQDRVGEQAARAEVEVSQEAQNTLSAESVSCQKKARKKSPGRLHVADGQPSGKSAKRGKKSASPEPEPARKTANRSSPAPGKDNLKSGSPMKAVKEPPTKVKRVAQSHVHSSRESLVFEDKVGMSQLKQKVKELTAKNKTLQSDVDTLKKQLATADRTKDIQKLQHDNKALLRELEEMRGSLKSQHKLSEQIQDLRARIEALVKEKDTLKKENQSLSDRINDGVSPPMMEFEELKVQNQQLLTANRSLTEKLDRDLMQAEQELAEMREKHKLAQVQKAEIEDEYKNFRDRIEKELYGLQARYDEVVEERDFLETQLINNRDHAEKDYQQLQAGYEEMRNEYEELQRAYDNDKDKARKELGEVKVKIESVKQDNEELKREIEGMTEDGARGKSGLQQQCAVLQEEKHNLSREIREYQNRLTTVEKAKEEVDKQLREIKTRYDNLKKYHEEEKVAAEEESDLAKTKYDSLKTDYDRQLETVEELKMEKNNLLHELNDSHAWCETLEMNLKETESTMHKETVTLKEELQFISEKLENETSVRNSLASAEEELRQKLIETSQELDKAKREAQATKEKHTAKLDNLHMVNSDLTTQIELVQDKLSEKQLEVEASNTELVTVRESYNQLMKSYEELSQIKEAMENEYRQMRNKFGVTESELQDFRKSYLTENMESGKLMSRFRVQFEQVTEERDRLKGDLKQQNQQLEEVKAKHLVQLEDNRALRSAIGAEVDFRFQTVTQIESILGDDRPPISPISPLCQSPAMSDSSMDYSGETGPSSENLMHKLHKQNTSLALLIQELENIKVARDQQMSRISTKYQSLQASYNDSLTSYNQDRSQLEEDLDKLRSDNEQLLETNQETDSKLQEMAKRCRVLEEELLRLQRDGADGTSSSTSTTEKAKKKYVVEMEDDVLTVSTVSITGEEPGQDSQEEEAMQYSPQLHSSTATAAQQMPSLVRRSTDPELIKQKDKTWEREYHMLQDKYMALLKEHDKVWQRVRQSPSHRAPIDLEGELTIEVTDSSIIELIEENSRLHALSTKLENELMSQRIDCLEVDAAYTELTWLREQKVKLEEKLRLQYQMFDQEKQVLEQRLNELQASLDKVISMKRRTSEEVLTLKNKYSDLLAVSSDEVKELAEQVSSEEDREKLVSKVADMERLGELETQVKHERDEKEFLQVQVTHLKKECELYERHVRDLEKEIDEQYTHLHEASREHKTMVQLLAETKLELELNREKHHQVTKIGQTVERIEAQLSGRSTPSLLCSPPLPVTSGASSPIPQPYIDSRPSTSCDSREEPQHIAETSRIVDEMVQLRHEIMEAKSMYSRERTLFRRTQQQGKASPGDQTAIKEELAVIEEQNLLLKRENEDLQKRLSEQEELVFHLQARLSSDSTDDGKDTLEAVFKQQLVLFRSERDALQQKVHVLEKHKQESRDLLREKTIMEETFNQEREALKQKLHEKELNEMELIHKITALEKHIREQQRLEDLIYHKSSLEDEIRRQKESFDHELLDVEKTLQDRRNMIKIERVKLLGELKQRYWQKILNVDDSEATESVGQPGHKTKSMASGFERLSRMKGEVEQRYREAIDRLRHELHADSHYATQRLAHH